MISQIDKEHLILIRENVSCFMKMVAEHCIFPSSLTLDIAPQDHGGAKPYFPSYANIETLDIDPNAGCTYTGDLCEFNSQIADERYDFIVCTEVLEHTLDPFAAVKEMYRMLKKGGKLFLSTPFNFRIHGPLPDCWRFTEHGLRAMFSKGFKIVKLDSLVDPDRYLMPIQYTLIIEKI